MFILPSAYASDDCVILLHGLARTKKSMRKMERTLTARGYDVVNDGYKSRKDRVEALAEEYIPLAIEKCQRKHPRKIHFVTHSMGGILVRSYFAKHELANLGRVVMLSPPNKGSEAVDKLSHVPGWKLINGTAGEQLNTSEDSLPLSLGPANFEVGIITGNKSVNLFLSTLIPGKDDGKVSIDSARLEGMTDFQVVEHSHPFIMQKDDVIGQTIHFLEYGTFEK
ncbi:MAG: alpha/beta hydrolase [Candidatus Omnitrophica bacterium]|nr:alpha/beta hydrolase [Candidatus Omnitrophota bacterium]